MISTDSRGYNEIFDKKISLKQKMDSIVFQVGKTSKHFGDVIDGDDVVNLRKSMEAYCGCEIEHGAKEINNLIRVLKDEESLSSNTGGNKISLTISGYKRYEEIKVSIKQSNKVFIAMQFNDESNNSYEAKEFLAEILDDCNLELFSMELNKELGNIIDTMKAEINRSKFIICDLSHGNKGAYWESGYAEGQGKKVIYIFDKQVFDEDKLLVTTGNKESKRIHFDIAQSRIVTFDLENHKDIFRKQIEDAIEANSLV